MTTDTTEEFFESLIVGACATIAAFLKGISVNGDTAGTDQPNEEHP
jgi:hypothetical protein